CVRQAPRRCTATALACGLSPRTRVGAGCVLVRNGRPDVRGGWQGIGPGASAMRPAAVGTPGGRTGWVARRASVAGVRPFRLPGRPDLLRGLPEMPPAESYRWPRDLCLT